MKRRDFLKTSMVGGAAWLGTSASSRTARAAAFGEVPASEQSSMLPSHLQVQSVLECYLLGGLTPWETYYCIPGRGQSDETWAYTNYGAMLKAAEGCGYGDLTNTPFTYFAEDSAGEEIFFGPFMARLLARPDVLARTRVVVTRHGATTHEAALPLVATGRTLGNASGAGLATHIGRYFADRDPEGSHAPPFSYYFPAAAGFTIGGGLLSPIAQGLHPARARPLSTALDGAARLDALLRRATVGTATEQAQFDALVREYFQQYGRRLELEGSSPLRAPGFAELSQAFAKQEQAAVIRSLLPESNFQSLSGESCRQVNSDGNGGWSLSPTPIQSSTNLPAMAFRMSAHLLTQSQYRARYAGVLDAGLQQADGGGGYDTHSNGPWRQASNLNNSFEQLLNRIKLPNEIAPSKIDLDQTLVILTSEFGRAPARQSEGQGRNHWPHGFAQIYIGGPVRAKGVYGHIEEDGNASLFTTPAENRIAALLALGIYPFHGDSFASGDVQEGDAEGAAVRSVLRRVFGQEV